MKIGKHTVFIWKIINAKICIFQNSKFNQQENVFIFAWT
jgi:hypothetical protein